MVGILLLLYSSYSSRKMENGAEVALEADTCDSCGSLMNFIRALIHSHLLSMLV